MLVFDFVCGIFMEIVCEQKFNVNVFVQPCDMCSLYLVSIVNYLRKKLDKNVTTLFYVQLNLIFTII